MGERFKRQRTYIYLWLIHVDETRMLQSSAIAALQREFLSLRALRKGMNTCRLAAIRTAVTPHGEPQGSSGCEKTLDTGPG